MSVKTGRYVIKRGGVEVPAEATWTIGPGVDSSTVQGIAATVTWAPSGVDALGPDQDTDVGMDGDDITIEWVDDDGTERVLTGYVERTAGQSLQDTQSRITDGTLRLTRALDLRPVAYTMPVNPYLAGAGGQKRHVGLFGVWFTHQAMTVGGFDPGCPMHWSSVWYQSMCGSAMTVPDKDHTFASLGEMRQCYRASNNTLAPTFPQGDTQRVAADVFSFGVTTPPKGTTGSDHWQLTVDMGTQEVDPTYGSEGEVLLRNLDTAAGVLLEWDATHMRVIRHNADNSRSTRASYPRATAGIRDSRWSIAVHPTDGTIVVRAGRWAGGVIGGTWEGRTVGTLSGSGVTLPTGDDGLCTVRVTSPGIIGPVAVTRGNRNYMATDQPQGRIYRHSMSAQSLPGFPWVSPREAGSLLEDQADAQRGMRAQPLWQWIDHRGILINTDYETLAAGSIAHTFDTRPGANSLALETLEYRTEPGGLHSAVEVEYTRASVALRSGPTIPLAQGSSQTLEDGDDYAEFLHPESGTFWLEPDLRPVMAGFPYPSPPYPSGLSDDLNRARRTWLGGHRVTEEEGETRGWIKPWQLGWKVLQPTGMVVKSDGTPAMTMLDPDTILVSGTVNMPQGPPVQIGETVTRDAGSLWATRRNQPLPQVRGYGLGTLRREVVVTDIAGLDSRHGPYRHDAGLWIQSTTGAERIASNLHDAITNPTPIRTVQVEQTGRVHVGQKVLLRERHADLTATEEEIVVAQISGSTSGNRDAMTLSGIVTARRVVGQADQDWSQPPSDITPEPPRMVRPPRWPGDPDPTEPPPVSSPTKPSTPMLAQFDPNVPGGSTTLVVSWDGTLDAGGSAIGTEFGACEVALGKTATPTELVGQMLLEGSVWRLLWTPPSLGDNWYARIRIVDLWGQAGAWSDAVSLNAVPQTDNLLVNPDTTVGAGGWDGILPVPITNHPSGGTGALQITATGTTLFGGGNSWIPCSPGVKFDFEALVQRVDAGSGSGSVFIGVACRGANGADLGLFGVDSLARVSVPISIFDSARWARLSGEGTAPAGCYQMRMFWWVDGDYTTGDIRATSLSMRGKGS